MDTGFTMTTSAKHADMTLHEFLTSQFPFLAPEDWSTHLISNSVLINGQVATGNPPLPSHAEIQFTLRNYQEDDVNTHWQLVWQNEALLVVNKPAMLPVQRTTRNIYNTLTNLVRRDLNLPQAQPLHRLDLETAGLMVFAKTKMDALCWQPKFNTLLHRKIYRAVVWGNPTWQHKTFTSYLREQPDSDIRCQMYVSTENNGGKLSTTHFRCLQTLGDFAIVECDLVTGRKHQLRAQLAYLGHPIVGDKIYAHGGEFYLKRLRDEMTEQDAATLKAEHHLLVACQLVLRINDQDEVIELADAQFPDAWLNFLAHHQ